MTADQRAVVLLSGGLDSATVLALARRQGLECYALSVAYGQRHGAELDAAARVARSLGVREHRVMRVDLAGIGGSALTDPALAVPESPTQGIPITYVPARNTMMLALALGWAEVVGATSIHVGVNAVDYSGYPDCRPEFIAAFEALAARATRAGVEGRPLRIQAPLIAWSKATIIRAGAPRRRSSRTRARCSRAAASSSGKAARIRPISPRASPTARARPPAARRWRS